MSRETKMKFGLGLVLFAVAGWTLSVAFSGRSEASYSPSANPQALSAQVELWDDLNDISPSVVKGPLAIIGTASGTGASATLTAASTLGIGIGGIRLSTGTTNAGWAYIGDGNFANSVWLGNGETTIEWRAKLTTLSDGTETYTARAGLIDAGNGNGTDGVFFRYTHGTNSGNWVLVARANNAETTTNSSIAASTSWVLLRIVVNAAGTSAEFFVNGTSAGTVASGLPTASGRDTAPCISIVKSAGTTARTMDVDYVYFKYVGSR